MHADYVSLLECFAEVGHSRGTMNGAPLRILAEEIIVPNARPGLGKVLAGLRRYERAKGLSRTYREQFRRLSRAEVAECRARKLTSSPLS